MEKRPKILVVGSFVMDLIVSTPRFPSAGETVIGCGFSTAPGGKGANQALQAARLGAEVTMAGRVGNDSFGAQILASLQKGGVDISHVRIDKEEATAVGNVQLEVQEKGTQNRIVVVPGANMRVAPEDVSFLEKEIRTYDLVMLQLEIPMEINEIVAGYAAAADVPVMLNPAPSAAVPETLLSKLTYLSPNEHEAADLTGYCPEGEEGIQETAEALRALGARQVLITLGKHGCVFADADGMVKSPCVDCGPVLDPTAAGDSFIAAFCTAVSAGAEIPEALAFANCTAGITVTRMGAQTSLPTGAEVLEMMKKKGFQINGGTWKWMY